MADADTRCDLDGEGAGVGWLDAERSGGEVAAVEAARDGQGLRELAGSAGEVRLTIAPAPHKVKTSEGLKRADEDATGLAVRFRYHVQTFVHAVDEVDVGVSWWTVDDFGAWRDTARGVGGFVFEAKIRFGLADDAGAAAVDETLAQERASHLNRGPLIEVAR